MSKQLIVFLLFGAARVVAQPSFLYPTTIPMGAPITSIVGGDFNNDGIGDLAVSYGTAAAIFLGKVDGTFARKDLNVPMGFQVYALAVTDINADHKLDLVGDGGYAFDPSNPSVRFGFFIMYGNGDGTFRPPVFPPPLTNGLLGIADFNGDGIPDLLVQVSSAIATQLGNGDGTFRSPGPSTGLLGSGYGGGTVVADFNNDGFPDVALTSSLGNATLIFLSNGDGSFRASGTAPGAPGSVVHPVAAGDVTGSGATDLVEQASGGVVVLLGNNKGQFSVRARYPSPMFVFDPDQPQVVLADFDGDKKLDFASCFYVYPGDGNGNFRAPIYFGQMTSFNFSAIGYHLPVIVQDVNGDGKPDIIGIAPDGQSINILINSSGTPVASAPAYLAGNGDIVLAPGALASIFGDGLASTTASGMVPLPTTIGNISVELYDSAGKTFQAPLLYVSPTQINFQVPDDASEGLAIINVIGNGRPKGAHSTYIQKFATSLFTLNGKGNGAPVSSALSVDASGKQTAIPTTSCNSDGNCVGLPIPVGSAGQVYLSLYGTGFGHATAGQCTIGRTAVTPTYIGLQGPRAVVDQVNIPIPANTPKGPVNISCQFGIAGMPGLSYNHGNGNTVTIMVQ
jgi:uncharacterized protein (TIGR03437 family)